ncbi:MAG: NAD(P)(+) transhydrogenase (Re/Si-specific) subunit beta [Spirochaetaceae bacterium]|jgi:NAD(P) transhydrogenase subunit beta|nr:NAD(P)(+) transhydrogenase (Re/Si-specific) subunit beta [Spirochaetaceae bacterium]
MISPTIVNLIYLLSATLFILGLKGLSHPKSAVRGNLLGAIGMFLAVIVTLVDKQIVSYDMIIIGVLAGSIIGTVFALTIKMTAMPQMVGLFNGLGGGASILVAGAVLLEAALLQTGQTLQFTIATSASGLIGAITLTGSFIAFGKLQGIITERPVRYKGEQIVKILLLLTSITLAVLIVLNPDKTNYYWILTGVAGLLGIVLVMAIGGADMPIVIALLNSYSGLAATATGFVLSNYVLIIAGSLVGASGIILTKIMCKAMNRSLANVLFGGMGAIIEQTETGDIYEGKVTSTSAEEIAMLLESARNVAIVPGYGMAVAKAQGMVRVLSEEMEKNGVNVVFGIHPVAGRMPGHMNVLLAEENVPYDKLLELDIINPRFKDMDVVIVLGANDVVNPVAREENNPISGMPILNVDQAKTVIMIKRSLSPGFAGIANPLFAADNTLMFFGDGRAKMEELVKAYKDL